MRQYKQFLIRPWQPSDRQAAAQIIRSVLADYGLGWEPDGSDADAIAVENYYWQQNGEFWVVETQGHLVGTGGYYPIAKGPKAVEIRKMYLLPTVRRQGLGRYLLAALEDTIQQRGYEHIWIETASVLWEAVKLYESAGYEPAQGVETARCDRIYVKTLEPKPSLKP